MALNSSVVASVSGCARGMIGSCLSLACVISLGLSPVAWADIYRWTDKDGNLHYSDTAPPTELNIKDVVVVTKSKPQVQPSGPSQQELLARIQSLEQQLQAQQNTAPPPVVAMAPSYAPPAPQPVQYLAPPVQPVIHYDAGYNAGVHDSFYNAPLLTSAVPVFVISATRMHPTRFGSAHRTPGRGSFHGGRGGGGRGIPRPPGGKR
jgi:hypothetical protein